MGLDVLLINPRSTYVNEIAQKVYPPLHLLYLAASLREQGFDADVLDANAFKMTDEQIGEHIRQAKPMLVGTSLYSEILRQIRDLVGLAKSSSDCEVVLGGPHATAVPDRVMENFPQVDYVLCNEADLSLPMLVKALKERRVGGNGHEKKGADGQSGKSQSTAGLADVPGLWYRVNGEVRHQACAAEQPDVKALPFPARELVDRAYTEARYNAIMVRQKPVDTIMTSRGCPFRCNFCYNNRFKYRGREPESVLEELIQIRRRGIRNVEIVDDHFTVDTRRAIRIFEMIIKEKLGISFRIKSRVDIVNEELLRRAREAGAYQVSCGMESGSQYMLDAMNKKIKVQQIVQAVEWAKRHGLAIHSSWIIGYPGETPETVEETIDLIIKTKPTTANIAALRPYPETEAYHRAKREGSLVGDWSPDTDEFPWVRLPWADSPQVLKKLVKQCMRRVYYRPYYVWSFGSEIVRNGNIMLAKYAAQELRKTLLPSTK